MKFQGFLIDELPIIIQVQILKDVTLVCGGLEVP